VIAFAEGGSGRSASSVMPQSVLCATSAHGSEQRSRFRRRIGSGTAWASRWRWCRENPDEHTGTERRQGNTEAHTADRPHCSDRRLVTCAVGADTRPPALMSGDLLVLDVDVPTPCTTQQCRLAAQYVVSAASPGLPWRRAA
jgi:hypothetical protein